MRDIPQKSEQEDLLNKWLRERNQHGTVAAAIKQRCKELEQYHDIIEEVKLYTVLEAVFSTGGNFFKAQSNLGTDEGLLYRCLKRNNIDAKIVKQAAEIAEGSLNQYAVRARNDSGARVRREDGQVPRREDHNGK